MSVIADSVCWFECYRQDDSLGFNSSSQHMYCRVSFTCLQYIHCQVVAAGQAPPGCSFSRPQFASASAAAVAAANTTTAGQHAGALGSNSNSATATAPLLQLDGLWHPLLGRQAGSSSSSSVVSNDVVLGGGNKPGAMLLTGRVMRVCVLQWRGGESDGV